VHVRCSALLVRRGLKGPEIGTSGRIQGGMGQAWLTSHHRVGQRPHPSTAVLRVVVAAADAS